jgi:PAS domain S-box-containing protein
MEPSSLNILIVEDEPGHAIAIQRAFAHARPQDRVTIVGSLKECREALKDAQPDLVITDIQLPDGKSFELLNSLEIVDKVPFVVMTSYGNEAVAVDAIKSGAIEYVVKSPETLNDMPHTVERVMREWAHVQEVQKARNALANSQAEHRSVFDGTPVMLCVIDGDRRVLNANRAFNDFVKGVLHDVPQQRPCGMLGCARALDDPAGCGFGPLCGQCALRMAMADTLLSATPHIDVECEIPIRHNGVEQTMVFLGSTTPMPPVEGSSRALVSLLDITDRKRLEEDLHRIEWMLSTPFESFDDDAQQKADYSDLTKLNQNGLILNSVGRDMLAKVTSEFLDLLGTSAAIYETNGDYAYGIFASGWCRTMDCASRDLCATSDNARALASGCWLCHESCWNSCAREVIARGETVDVECAGGIRLFGAPIFYDGAVIGVINFGYGDPPKDPQKLEELARSFKVDYETLRSAAEAYQARPSYIIEMAKRRLLSSAQTIEHLVARRQAENKLRTNEERLRLARKATNDVVWDWDVVNDTQRWNEAGKAIFGWTESIEHSVSAHWWVERVHPDDVRRVEDGFYSVVNNPKIDYWQDEYRFRKADGSYAMVMDRGYILRDSDGRALRMVGAMLDITERKHSEQKLSESEALLARSQQVAHIGSWQLDVAAKQMVWSDELYRVLGFSPDKHVVTYETFFEIVHPDDMPAAWDFFMAFFSGEKDSLEYSHRIIRKDTSEIRYIYERCINERDADGTIVRFIGMIQDITERKQAEEKSAEHLRELEQWYRVTLNREDRVLELKDEVNTLLKRLGEEPKYGKEQL